MYKPTAMSGTYLDPDLNKLQKFYDSWGEFPGGPVVTTLHFCC